MNALRWLALAACFGVCLPASAQDDWTGKRVILKHQGVRIGYTDDKGNQVFVAELTRLSYPVLKDGGAFLKVQHRGNIGWFAKNDALLPDDALPFFAERARLADPKDSVPFAYLGWAHKERQQFALAIIAYDAALKRDPRPEWFNNRGEIHSETKKYDLAVADFTEAVKRAPKFVTAFENRAAAFGAMNKAILALDDWNEALRLEPGNAAALRGRAKLYVDQKDTAKAIADLTAILKDDPRNVAVLVDRGQLHADQHRTEEALADFNRAILLDKTDADIYLSRSLLFTDKKEFAKALDDAEEAMRLVPTMVDARLARGWNLFLTGEFDKANADFAKALDVNPNHAPTYNFQAWLWATCPDEKLRDGKKAVEFAKKAVELTQGKEPAMLDTQAAALAEAGDFDRAIEVQERVLRELGANGEPLPDARARLELYRKREAFRQKIAK